MLPRIIAYISCAAVIAIVVFNTTPPMMIDGRFLQTGMSFGVLLFVLQIFIVWLFLSSLHTFSGRLRLAYTTLSVGMLLLGIAGLQFPILSMRHELDSWWVSSGAATIPFVVAGLAIYLGIRNFARILSVHFFATTLWHVLGITILACVAITLVPHLRITPTPTAELQYDVFMALLVWVMSMELFAALILWRIRHVIGPLYTGAVTWLAVAMSLTVATGLLELFYSLLSTYSLTWYTKYALNLIPSLLPAIAALIAGSVFKSIAERRLNPDADYIDVIVYMEKLASSPDALDKEMDQLRLITARLNPDHGHLSDNDVNALVTLYLKIEHYLVNNEPLRHFTQEELRALLPEKFANLLNDHKAYA